jgi:hypothetical protein
MRELVPLIDQAATALDALSCCERFADEDGLVFVDEVGGHVDDWQLRGRFHAALDRAGLRSTTRPTGSADSSPAPSPEPAPDSRPCYRL